MHATTELNCYDTDTETNATFVQDRSILVWNKSALTDSADPWYWDKQPSTIILLSDI